MSWFPPGPMVRPLAAGQLPPDWYDVYNSNIYGSGKIDINCIANIVRNDLRLKSVLQGMNLFWTSPPHGWWSSLIDSYSHSISSKALVVSINQGSSLTPPNPSFFPLTHQTNTSILGSETGVPSRLAPTSHAIRPTRGTWRCLFFLFSVLAPETHFLDSSSFVWSP